MHNQESMMSTYVLGWCPALPGGGVTPSRYPLPKLIWTMALCGECTQFTTPPVQCYLIPSVCPDIIIYAQTYHVTQSEGLLFLICRPTRHLQPYNVSQLYAQPSSTSCILSCEWPNQFELVWAALDLLCCFSFDSPDRFNNRPTVHTDSMWFYARFITVKFAHYCLRNSSVFVSRFVHIMNSLPP